eukprot:2521749-Pleurochrysis_carterae.AAC.2
MAHELRTCSSRDQAGACGSTSQLAVSITLNTLVDSVISNADGSEMRSLPPGGNALTSSGHRVAEQGRESEHIRKQLHSSYGGADGGVDGEAGVRGGLNLKTSQRKRDSRISEPANDELRVGGCRDDEIGEAAHAYGKFSHSREAVVLDLRRAATIVRTGRRLVGTMADKIFAAEENPLAETTKNLKAGPGRAVAPELLNIVECEAHGSVQMAVGLAGKMEKDAHQNR